MSEPSFILPPGTQVVLKADRRLPGRESVAPAGSVAEVVETPATNARAYKVRLLDGTELRAKFGELSVRSREVAEELITPGEDMRPFVIYRVEVGSRAFGLSTVVSDSDRRGVYLPPADMHWGLNKPPEQLDSRGDGVEEVLWELEKFLRLGLSANPNILETLWSPRVLYLSETGRELRDIREAFLSRHLYKTYSGYVLSQLRLIERRSDDTGRYKPKHAMHLLRLQLGGIHALRGGGILVDVSEHRDELMEVRSGAWPFDRVKARALELDAEFQRAFRSTALPERPDYARVNSFLITARRGMVL